ncbi:MAG: shikimate kinase [Pseudomonadota bacterium]
MRVAAPVPAPESRDPLDVEISRLSRQIGAKIRSTRQARGEPRRVLSERSGVSQRYLAQIEAGEGNISVAMLVKLGVALEIPVSGFFEHEQSEDTLRIALIGLRGAGKSTLGQNVANTMGVPFVELNDMIEQQSGLSVADVIAMYGPDGYRGFERSALEAVVSQQQRVILAVAGGIVGADETFGLLLKHFQTVWVQASPEEHMNRVIAQGDERPMAGNPRAMDELKSILLQRTPAYARAHAVLDTSGRSLAESEHDLLSLLRGLDAVD